MRKGSSPRSIVLPTSTTGRNHYPDGLTEPDIDALIAEADAEVKSVRPRPGWLSADQVEVRRARRTARQNVRMLANRACFAVIDQQTTDAVLRTDADMGEVA